ncbi:MAG: RNA 2',3'-cyclic phosphodiesterase [Bacteroidetes bacterium]|nr:RNA 2',3'-cyclic phosphodiesterase [Bacteroidota bacterium]MBL6944438.1 RNA 2',3'-cyclic phosphodiesterase [Bacteroidales bacterium]
MKRLFVAIKIIPDENSLRVYHSLKQALIFDKIRWVDPDNFHITLKFFGNTTEERIPDISNVVQNTVELFKPLNIELKNAGIFGSSYKPRVIWFGIAENKQLTELGINLLNNLNDAGFPKDRQNFVPHLTIGRITKITDKQLFMKEIEKVKNVFFQKSKIDKVILFESILSTHGPTYKVINSFPLKN